MEKYDTEKINRYECETCTRVDETTEQQAYEAGWDYPPFIGIWGVVSPRTCPNCLIDTTAYWFILTQDRNAEMPERHKNTILRISKEEEEHAAA
jgi:hypothetical protein